MQLLAIKLILTAIQCITIIYVHPPTGNRDIISKKFNIFFWS